MVAEIESNLGLTPELIAGSSGIFEVRKDGEIVFSKKDVGRFPEEGELAALFAK